MVEIPSVATLPVTVAIPTVGRPVQLAACLESISACRPHPAEILVVSQGEWEAIRALVNRFPAGRARALRSAGRGVSIAMNEALRSARHEIVLLTDDDCVVADTWVARAYAHVTALAGGIVTGRVLPAGNPAGIPSTIDKLRPAEYVFEADFGVLYTGNMACERSRVLELGGFDERIGVGADNDFCYRWLRAHRRLRYEPDLVVWHRAWRTPKELEHLWVDYAFANGVVYGKWLRAGDLTMLRHVARDVRTGIRGLAARIRGKPRSPDSGRGMLRGLPRGLVHGLMLSETPGSRRAQVEMAAPVSEVSDAGP